MDGDPSCDGDGLANGVCEVEVSVCLNVEDPRLVDDLGAPACTASAVDRWILKKPKPDSTKPTEAPNAIAIRDAVAALAAGSIGGAHQEVVTFAASLAAADTCTAPVAIQVPLKSPTRMGKAVLRMQSVAGALRDNDKLKITCLPSDVTP
jgi:hypothetical protein